MCKADMAQHTHKFKAVTAAKGASPEYWVEGSEYLYNQWSRREICFHFDIFNLKVSNKTKAAFQIAYFVFLLLARAATALTEYILVHAVYIHLGHTTTHNTAPWTLTLLLIQAAQRIVGQNSQKRMLACILQNVTGCSRTSWYF